MQIIKASTRNGEPVQLWGARPMTRDELRAASTPLAFGPTVAMSRRRAIWYGATLTFATVIVVAAVFGVVG